MPLKDAATLLFFTSKSDLLRFAEKVSCPISYFIINRLCYILQRGWEVNLTAATISFARKSEENMEIPKQKLIAANLAYARELEQIV